MNIHSLLITLDDLSARHRGKLMLVDFIVEKDSIVGARVNFEEAGMEHLKKVLDAGPLQYHLARYGYDDWTVTPSKGG